MTVARTALALTRYKLLGGRKKVPLSELNQLVLKRQAKNIKISGVYKDLNYGWVRPVELADEAVSESKNWDMSDCRIASGYLLRLRIEKRKVPGGLMQLVMRERIMQRESKRDKPLSRGERKELKEQLKVELIEHCLPTLSYIDAYWNEANRQVCLFASSKQQQDIFEEIFRDSFLTPLNMHMVRVLPPILGLADDEVDLGADNRTYVGLNSATPSMMSL